MGCKPSSEARKFHRNPKTIQPIAKGPLSRPQILPEKSETSHDEDQKRFRNPPLENKQMRSKTLQLQPTQESHQGHLTASQQIKANNSISKPVEKEKAVKLKEKLEKAPSKECELKMPAEVKPHIMEKKNPEVEEKKEEKRAERVEIPKKMADPHKLNTAQRPMPKRSKHGDEKERRMARHKKHKLERLEKDYGREYVQDIINLQQDKARRRRVSKARDTAEDDTLYEVPAEMPAVEFDEPPPLHTRTSIPNFGRSVEQQNDEHLLQSE